MLHRFEIPESFLRRHRLVISHTHGTGVHRYLFDVFQLGFYRSMATQPIDSSLIWSVVGDEGGSAYHLRPGEGGDAVGFVLAQRPAPGDTRMPVALHRRLTYRQKLRRCLLHSLLGELSQRTFQTPAEVIEFIAVRASLNA